MKTSLDTDKILPKLFNIQAEVKSVTKNAKNGHFRNSYADLNEILEATKEAVKKQKCILLQPPTASTEDQLAKEMVETIIIDTESGQFVSASMFVDGSDIQKRCACVTYVRRVTLKSLLSLEEEDDDGNTATGAGKSIRQQSVSTSPVKEDSGDLEVSNKAADKKDGTGTSGSRSFRRNKPAQEEL